MNKVVIIGAGLGGLSAAISLAVKGFHVTVIEKNSHAGGKLMPVKLGDYSFDFGPNTITMPEIFQEVVQLAGENPNDYFTFQKIEQHTRNISHSGDVFDLSSNRDYMIEQLQKMDAKGAANYDLFLKDIAGLYELGRTYFFRKTFTSKKDFFSPKLGLAFLKVKPFQTMDSFFKQYFSNPFILQVLNRYATYIGSSPYITPATFSLIAYLELAQGVYYTRGGNVKIAQGIYDVAKKLGVNFYFNEKVTKVHVRNKRAMSVETDGGNVFEADEVVMNADLLHAYPELVQEVDRPNFTNKQAESYEPSISAFVILAGTKSRNESLLHHTVYFSSDYKKEFNELFQKKQFPSEPTVYISNSSVTDRSQSLVGDNLFILANAPATKVGECRDDLMYEQYKDKIYSILEDKGLSLSNEVVKEKIIGPHDIQTTFGAYRGALYGIASNKKMDAFFRPSNKAKDIENIYFAGGSTNPGGGSPMVTLSGLNVANLVASKYVNT